LVIDGSSDFRQDTSTYFGKIPDNMDGEMQLVKPKEEKPSAVKPKEEEKLLQVVATEGR
jgi:hypothetical protein